MFFNRPLFRWLFRRVRWITLLGLIVALLFVLFEPTLLTYSELGWVLLFTLIHSLLIVRRLGHSRHRSFGFLYTQGYSRDTIWWHTMLTSAASVLVVWLPVSLVIWTGLRCELQDAMLNYRFPVMSLEEQTYPFWALLSYVLFLPTFHYAWIRQAQPTRGESAGSFVAIAVVIVILSLWNSVRIPLMPNVAQWLMLAGLVITSITLLIGGWRLHRQVEVTS